jgi:hypothetical protein
LGSLDKSDYPNIIDYNIDLISILCDVDIEEIESLDLESFKTLEQSLSFAKNPPIGFSSENVIDFHQISLGAFIDIEHYITDKNNLSKVLTFLMPKFTEVEILEMPCSDVANIILKYVEFREMILKAYPNIFAPQFEDEEDTTNYTDEELKEIEAEKKQTSHSWEKFIMKCCNNDMTKFDAVTNMNLILVFNLFVTL